MRKITDSWEISQDVIPIGTCPKCGELCDRDSVDVEVGVIYGPWGCYCCGWSENSDYDSSEGDSPSQRENPDWLIDCCGGMIRKSAGKTFRYKF